MPIRIMVTADGSEPSRKAEEFVVRLNRTLPLQVLLVHAFNVRRLEYKMIPDFQVEMIRQGAKRAAETLLEKEKRFFEESGVTVDWRLLEGEPAEEICKLAETEKPSLVVTGRRGQGDLQDILFGSVSNHLLHHCRTPVLIAKRRGEFPSGDDADRPLRVLVPIDDSMPTRRCLDWLTSCSELSKGLNVTLLHVVSLSLPGLEVLPASSRQDALESLRQGGEGLLASTADRLRTHGFTVETALVDGELASRMICQIYSEKKFELIVMGMPGLGELGELVLGSVSHYVVHHCEGHVLVVP